MSQNNQQVSQNNSNDSTGYQAIANDGSKVFLGGNHTHSSGGVKTSRSIKKILLLSANPHELESLRRSREVAEINEVIDKVSLHLLKEEKSIVFDSPINKPNVKADDVSELLSQIEPYVVDISGVEDGIASLILGEGFGANGGQDPDQWIGDLFRVCARSTKCVVLNGCYVEGQAREIVQYIDFLVSIGKDTSEESEEIVLAFLNTFYY